MSTKYWTLFLLLLLAVQLVYDLNFRPSPHSLSIEAYREAYYSGYDEGYAAGLRTKADLDYITTP